MIKTWRFVLILALTFSIAPTFTKAANILALLPSFSPSHLIIEMAVVKAMAERNHNVTVVSVLPLKSDWLHPNMTYIKLNKGSIDMDKGIKATQAKGLKKITMALGVMHNVLNGLAEIFEDHKFQELLQNSENKFDLMLFGYIWGDFFFGVAEHFNCPVALLWPNIPIVPVLNLIGSPLAMSYTVVTLINTVSSDKGFMFRLKNVVAVTGELLLNEYLDREMSQIYSKNFPADKYVGYDKAKGRVSMVLFSHHFSEKPIRPLVPALIEIGGIHLNEETKPLPKDIEDFISSAEHGIIFFSMGTNVKQHHMQAGFLEKIFNVFSRLPQKGLWKVDDESRVPGNASNILYRKWLPQADILGHSNVKLFFGHGGKGGITEAKFYGVPMVGLPIFDDQPMNMEEVVDKGYGLSIDHEKPLTEEVIYETVIEVLKNSKYAFEVKKFSNLYRNRPLKAKENAVYWLEYLIRYKGAAHMQSPLKKMSFIEATNLDVIVLCLAVLYVIVKIIKLFFKILVKYVRHLVGGKRKKD